MPSPPLQTILDRLHRRLAGIEGGSVATYIPALAGADPNHFAIAIVTTDGAIYAAGDADVAFTIQSISKPFAYAAALDLLGREAALARVGVEPTGDAFNSIVLDNENNRPFNPMVNAGAIAASALFPGKTREERAEAMLATLSRFAGRRLGVDEEVFRSEAETGHRNRAIAWLMLNSEMLAAAPDDALDVYFRQCSALVDTRDLAVMAATLANGGVNPLTGERAMIEQHVGDVLTVMLTCGMYDYAGQWAYEVGLPAKSGVSGAVAAVAPGQFGIAAFSPRLDRFGNSVRAVAACRALSEELSLHSLRLRPDAAAAVGRVLSGRDLRSSRRRHVADAARLDANGEAIVAIEAHGGLFPAAMERVLRRIDEAVAQGREVILSLRQVSHIEPGSRLLLKAWLDAFSASSRTLIVACPDGSFARDVLSGEGAPNCGFVLAATLDCALELAEDRLLGTRATADPDELPLEACVWLLGTPDDETAALLSAVAPQRAAFTRESVILRRGDPCDHLYVVASGRVRVEVPATLKASVRLDTLGPGATVGEMGLFRSSPRSADVIADTDVVCWRIDYAPLRGHLKERPSVANAILMRLVGDLSTRLERASGAVRSLGL